MGIIYTDNKTEEELSTVRFKQQDWLWNLTPFEKKIMQLDTLYGEAYEKKMGSHEPRRSGKRTINGKMYYFSICLDTVRWTCSCEEHIKTYGQYVPVKLNNTCNHIREIAEKGKNSEFRHLNLNI